MDIDENNDICQVCESGLFYLLVTPSQEARPEHPKLYLMLFYIVNGNLRLVVDGAKQYKEARFPVFIHFKLV